MNIVVTSDQCMIRTDSPLLEGWENCNTVEALKAYADPTDYSIVPGLTWKGAQMSKELWSEVIGTAEAFPNMEINLSLYYNRKKEKWGVKCPEQKGYAASVSALDQGNYPDAGFALIGSLHTHPYMTAFWSTTDRKDQSKVAGVHIVLGLTKGKVTTTLCTIFTPFGEYDQLLDTICEPVDFAATHTANPEWVKTIKTQSYVKPPTAYTKPTGAWNSKTTNLWAKTANSYMPHTVNYTGSWSTAVSSTAHALVELETQTKSTNPVIREKALLAKKQVAKVREALTWLEDNDFEDAASQVIDEVYDETEGSLWNKHTQLRDWDESSDPWDYGILEDGYDQDQDDEYLDRQADAYLQAAQEDAELKAAQEEESRCKWWPLNKTNKKEKIKVKP